MGRGAVRWSRGRLVTATMVSLWGLAGKEGRGDCELSSEVFRLRAFGEKRRAGRCEATKGWRSKPGRRERGPGLCAGEGQLSSGTPSNELGVRPASRAGALSEAVL